MNDYIRKKDALVALSGLLKDIKENPIGNGGNDFADGIWQGERSCAIEAILRIKALPAEDVKPVVHGTWIPYTEEVDGCKFIGHRCSICNEWEGFAGSCNFCPSCGADMRGEETNERNEET
jgi:hypothetical protein